MTSLLSLIFFFESALLLFHCEVEEARFRPLSTRFQISEKLEIIKGSVSHVKRMFLVLEKNPSTLKLPGNSEISMYRVLNIINLFLIQLSIF
jgi:hypothetical protein